MIRGTASSAAATNVHRVLAHPDDDSRRCRPREDARYELQAAPCESPPGSRDHPGNVRGHRTSGVAQPQPRGACHLDDLPLLFPTYGEMMSKYWMSSDWCS